MMLVVPGLYSLHRGVGSRAIVAHGRYSEHHLLAERVSGFDQNQTLARKLTRLNYAKYSRIFARDAVGYMTEAVALRTSNLHLKAACHLSPTTLA